MTLFIWIRKCLQQKQQQKAQKLMITHHGKHSKWVCLGHFRNTERYEISRNNFFPITEVICIETQGLIGLTWHFSYVRYVLCSSSKFHEQWGWFFNKAPAKFFGLWASKSWGCVPCMGCTWWLWAGQLYWQPSSSDLSPVPRRQLPRLGGGARHVTLCSSLENEVTQRVTIPSEEQGNGENLWTWVLMSWDWRAFMGKL